MKSANPCDQGGLDVVPAFVPFGHDQLCVFGTTDGSALFGELKMWQTPAVLEVLHCAGLLGLVKSKVATVLPQVLSRVGMVWWILWAVPESTINTSECWLMALAWGITEVIRYSWYACKEVTGSAPFPLTWCRYTFFIVLYPTGVYGELCTELAASRGFDAGAKASVLYRYFVYIIMAMYPIFFPMLYLHMFSQRKKEINPKKPRAPRPDHGVIFPKDPKTGETKTSVEGARTIAAALRPVDPEAAEAAEKAGKKWRFGYVKHFTKMVKASAQSAENAVAVAKAGLDHLHNEFKFVVNEGDEPISLAAAMTGGKDYFRSERVSGSGDSGAVPEFTVPYEGAELAGDALLKKIQGWVDYGTIEPDCGDALTAFATDEKLRSLAGHTFVMIGASSAMGPYLKLLAHGATVVALDVPNHFSRHPNLWKYLIETAEKSPGKLIFPVHPDNVKKDRKGKVDKPLYETAGCNLLAQAPAILEWLKQELVGKEFTIGNYTYLDGALHVKLSLASDAIMKGLIDEFGTKVSLAFLCTPTDLMPIKKEVYEAAVANRSALRPNYMIEVLFQMLLGKPKPNCMKPSAGSQTYLVDGIIVAQGPNYALAKRLQHWRAMLAYEKGCRVSTNIAPSTATASVTSNVTFKWAYGGMPWFKPFYIPFQETTNAVMAALLVHDITAAGVPADPANKAKHGIKSPLDLFKFGSFHGGLWRCGYSANSIGEMSVLIHFLGGPTLFTPIMFAMFAAFGYFLSSPAFLESAIVTTVVADVGTLLA